MRTKRIAIVEGMPGRPNTNKKTLPNSETARQRSPDLSHSMKIEVQPPRDAQRSQVLYPTLVVSHEEDAHNRIDWFILSVLDKDGNPLDTQYVQGDLTASPNYLGASSDGATAASAHVQHTGQASGSGSGSGSGSSSSSLVRYAAFPGLNFPVAGKYVICVTGVRQEGEEVLAVDHRTTRRINVHKSSVDAESPSGKEQKLLDKLHDAGFDL
ncbi:hypothetical protein BX600DRAFT_433888 [Xylariales sp. PMI_506]|nr:hypothetical protein BX600DRAFT_433888 [Xylariales sp. PMI_506]